MYKSLVKREHFEKCFRFYFFYKNEHNSKRSKITQKLEKMKTLVYNLYIKE